MIIIDNFTKVDNAPPVSSEYSLKKRPSPCLAFSSVLFKSVPRMLTIKIVRPDLKRRETCLNNYKVLLAKKFTTWNQNWLLHPVKGTHDASPFHLQQLPCTSKLQQTMQFTVRTQNRGGSAAGTCVEGQEEIGEA
jgi:hypothetical protein